MADTVAGILGEPFPEQVAAFRLRLGNLVPTQRWDDISGAAHDRAFMVAGAAKAELLADLAGAVDKAIAEGTGLEAFRRDFREIVTRRGWHGWTGEGSTRGEAWRTRVIYRTNMSTTYAAGRLAQLVEGGFTLWVYRHGGSREPRIQHLGWDGLSLPPDHAWWATHYPPNGWGCSCFVLGARSDAGARRLGGDPEKPLPPGWDSVSPRTGAPPGIDRGWNHAPGRGASDAILALRGRLSELPERPSVALIRDWLAQPALERWLSDPRGDWPVARLPAGEARALAARDPVADITEAAARALVERGGAALAAELREVQRIVETASEVFRPRPGIRVYLLREPGSVLLATIDARGASPRLTALRRLSSAEAARDAELAELRR